MKRAAALFVDMLPLDAAARRAVDETLADWRYEEGASRSRVQRLAVAVHGWSAIVGTLCRVTAREAVASRTWTMFGASLATTLAISLALVVGATLWRDGQLGSPATTMLLPMAIASAMPLVLLVPPFRIRRGPPILGLSLMLWVTAAINTGWVVPASIVSLKQTTALTAPSSPAPHEEQAIPELFATARSGGFEGLRAAQVLSDRLAYVTLAPAALLLGVQTRRFTHHRGWRVGAGAMAIAIAAFAAFPAVLAVDSVREFLRSQFYPAEELRFFRYWVSPLFVFGACAVLSRLIVPAPHSDASERGRRAFTAGRSY